MRPPFLAQALVAAAAPASDYEIVAGDLHEEYLRIMHAGGAKVANRWYWAQTVRSIPSLLSYSRSNRSALRQLGVAFTALGVLVAMLVIDTIVQIVFAGMDQGSDWVWFCAHWTVAVAFGAILARLVKTDSLRVTFFAALFLVLCFVIPAVAGHPGSQATLAGWIVLWGAIPAMCIGAGLYQVIRHRIDTAR